MKFIKIHAVEHIDVEYFIPINKIELIKFIVNTKEEGSYFVYIITKHRDYSGIAFLDRFLFQRFLDNDNQNVFEISLREKK